MRRNNRDIIDLYLKDRMSGHLLRLSPLSRGEITVKVNDLCSYDITLNRLERWRLAKAFNNWKANEILWAYLDDVKKSPKTAFSNTVRNESNKGELKQCELSE